MESLLIGKTFIINAAFQKHENWYNFTAMIS